MAQIEKLLIADIYDDTVSVNLKYMHSQQPTYTVMYCDTQT